MIQILEPPEPVVRKKNVILYEERKTFLGNIDDYSSLEFLPALCYSSDHLFEKNGYKEETNDEGIVSL